MLTTSELIFILMIVWLLSITPFWLPLQNPLFFVKTKLYGYPPVHLLSSAGCVDFLNILVCSRNREIHYIYSHFLIPHISTWRGIVLSVVLL